MHTVQWDSSHVRRSHDLKQNWERLYRTAILESDRSKLPERIEVAEAAILGRLRSLGGSPASSARERDVINRALYILRLLRETSA